MQKFTRKENFLLANTLNCIPFLLQGQAVLIDLRNDCSVAGRICNVDGHMNINLTEVVFINRLGQQFPFEQFMVRERIIRQIHISEHIDMAQEIEQWCEKGCIRKPLRSREGHKGRRTFKQKRAQERHREILQDIEKQQQIHKGTFYSQ
ncbi:U7 small nuclear RNA associated Lsm10 [Cochliomyia hominivorax]